MFYVRSPLLCANYPTLKTARGMKAADLIFMSAQTGLTQTRPDKMFNVCIHNKGADKNVRYPD